MAPLPGPRRGARRCRAGSGAGEARPGQLGPIAGRAASLALIALCACGASLAAATEVPGKRDPGESAGVWPHLAYPSAAAIRRAQRFAAARGDVSFAVIDPSSGMHGYDAGHSYSSASLSKALLLAAELRRLDRERLPLDGETRALLEPMVTLSDNRAADAVYARVGDAGLEEVGRRARMAEFEPVPGFWGGDHVTAADMARFFYRLNANLPRAHRHYAKLLLSRISPVESWGIPEVLGRGWSVWFKGGWRPPGGKHNTGTVTHQAALLVHRGGERLALAVLSDEAPWGGGGFETIEGVARRLLASPPPYRGEWVAP